MHQSVNSNSTGAFFISWTHALIAALVIPAAYYSTQTSDNGEFTLKWVEALKIWMTCQRSGPIGHFARHSSCSPFRLLCIYFLPSSFLDYRRWPLITLIRVAENPCPTLCSRNPRERGGARGRGGEGMRCSCGNSISTSHIYCKSRSGWQWNGQCAVTLANSLTN
jgi:hypothetical protein